MNVEAGKWRTRTEWAQLIVDASVDVGIKSPHLKGESYKVSYIANAGHLSPRKYPKGYDRNADKTTYYSPSAQVDAAEKAVNYFARKLLEYKRNEWIQRAVELVKSRA